MLVIQDIVQAMDTVVDHHLDDEVVDSLVDEVEVEDDEEVGKKSDYFRIIILYFFRKCLY